MKKLAYVAPVAVIVEAEDTEMFCSSITGVAGDAGLQLDAVNPVPTEAEVRELGWEF